MSRLRNAEDYPPAVLIVMESMPALAVEIANRWMKGWPERTRQLLDAGDFLVSLALEIAWVQEACGPTPPADGEESSTVVCLAGRRPPPCPKKW